MTLTQIDQEILDEIEQTFTTTGFVPQSADIAEKYGLSSGRGMKGLFDRLEAAGAILRSEDRKRYVPARWRELAVTEEDRSAIIAGREAKRAADKLEQIRLAGVERTRKYREKMKKKAGKRK